MKNNSLFLSIIISLFLFTACEKAIIGTAEVNDPENNFELLWNDFESHYALFDIKKIDWQDAYDRYRPRVKPETTDAELWTVLTQMLEELNDGHVSLENTEMRFESGYELSGKALEEFSLELIQTKYLNRFVQTSEEDLSFGTIKDKDIGYIHLFGVGGDDPTVIDGVMDELKDHKAIIVDLRNNGGGNDAYAARIAGVFADGAHLIYTVETRNGPNYNDFDQVRTYYTKPTGEEQFLKPVILLTDRYTASGAEIMTDHMKAFAQVTQIGDNTAGDLSDVSNTRFLPNGWVYYYSTQRYLTPDGKSLEGIGHTPDVFIKNTKADIEARNDKVLEQAFAYLLAEHNIE